MTLGLRNRYHVTIRGRPIQFPDVQKSVLLRQIVLDGYRFYKVPLVTLLENYPFKIGKFNRAGGSVGLYFVLASLSLPKVEAIAAEPFPPNISYVFLKVADGLTQMRYADGGAGPLADRHMS